MFSKLFEPNHHKLSPVVYKCSFCLILLPIMSTVRFLYFAKTEQKIISCFVLTFSGDILPYLFTICATAASVKCAFITGEEFSAGLFVFSLNFWEFLIYSSIKLFVHYLCCQCLCGLSFSLLFSFLNQETLLILMQSQIHPFSPLCLALFSLAYADPPLSPLS